MPASNETPDESLICLLDCKHNRARIDTIHMVRCCLCMEWFHTDCHNVSKQEIKNVWNCQTCREMPQVTKELLNMMKSITTEFRDFSVASRGCDERVANLETEVGELKKLLDEKDDIISILRMKLLQGSPETNTSTRTGGLVLGSQPRKAPSMPTFGQMFDVETLPPELRKYTVASDAEMSGWGMSRDDVDDKKSSNEDDMTDVHRLTYSDAVRHQAAPKRNVSEAGLWADGNGRNSYGKQNGRAGTIHQKAKKKDHSSKQQIKRNNTVPGSKETTTTSAVQAAPRRFTFRINNLNLDTSCDNLRDYIEQEVGDDDAIDKESLRVEEIPPPPEILRPRYKCFKIQVSRCDKDIYMNPEMWPKNSFVRPFRPKRPADTHPQLAK